MKNYRLFTICYLSLLILIAIIFNTIFLPRSTEKNRYYAVEINRIMSQLETNGFSDHTAKNSAVNESSLHIDNIRKITSINLEEFQTIENLLFLAADAEKEDILSFYADIGDSDVRVLVRNEKIEGYVKFLFNSHLIHSSLRITRWMNWVFAVLFIFSLAFIIYTGRQIIKPFQTFSNLPENFARGNLEKSIKDHKNRYFGKFFWGLDMLRESLADQKKRALALEKEKKTLVLSLSHDIKTPLSAIKLYVQALNSSLYTNPEKKNAVIAAIGNNADEIERLVNDMIRGTNENMFEITVQLKEFYLADAVNSLMDIYQERFELMQVKIEIGEYTNVLLYGDFDRTIEALGNVFENALKYGDGKRIWVEFSNEEDCQLLTISSGGNTLMENELPHIFDSFWRGSNAEGKSGNGLGLFIVRQIMNKMNGDVYASTINDILSITFVLKIV